jgi:hypothetical protein
MVPHLPLSKWTVLCFSWNAVVVPISRAKYVISVPDVAIGVEYTVASRPNR